MKHNLKEAKMNKMTDEMKTNNYNGKSPKNKNCEQIENSERDKSTIKGPCHCCGRG